MNEHIEHDGTRWRLLQAERLLVEAGYFEDEHGEWRLPDGDA